MKLLPCPFCEGPPCISAHEYLGGAMWRDEAYPDDGIFLEAQVWCHECGAHGPKAEKIACDHDDYVALETEACELWNQRDNRNRDCYDGGEAEGLNEYPERVHTSGIEA